jgi:hypothetical protein
LVHIILTVIPLTTSFACALLEPCNVLLSHFGLHEDCVGLRRLCDVLGRLLPNILIARRKLCIPCLELILGRHRALHGIHYTRKLGQQIVPRGVHDPTPVLFDEGKRDLLVSLKGFDGRGLVVTHQPAIACYISAEDRCQLAFQILRVHGIGP